MVRFALPLFLLAFAPAFAQDPAKPAPPKGQRIFVTGHSFHAFLDKPLAEVAKSAGIDDHKDAGKQMIGGSRVSQHWDLADEKNTAKKALKAGEVDVLTCSPHLKIPDEGIDKFAELLMEHNPKGRYYIQASWMPHDLPGKNGGNFKNEERDDVKVEDIRKHSETWYKQMSEQIESINKKYAEKAGRPVAYFVPVGPAVYTLREKVVAGKVPGIAKQSELFTDSIGHAKAPVIALVIYCNYAAIYGVSPVGLPMPKFLAAGKYDEKLNALLQEIAWDAVTAEPLSGVKKPAR